MDKTSVTDQVIDLLEEVKKWRRQRKILNFLMCFLLFFFLGTIARNCYLKHQFNAVCYPGQFESFDVKQQEWVICSDGVGKEAWVVVLKE